jgi:hypothetical protein
MKMKKNPDRENRYKRFYGIPNQRLRNIWGGMKARCNIENNPAYKNYGGKGVKVDEQWQKHFLYFYDWAIENGYQDDLTIERIDVNGNYEPSNCKWIPKGKQAHNTTQNVNITHNGKTMCLEEWARETGVSSKVIKFRLSSGLSFEKAISKKKWRRNEAVHVTKEVIEELYKELGEYKKVAEKLNKSRATVSRIINNKLKGE